MNFLNETLGSVLQESNDKSLFSRHLYLLPSFVSLICNLYTQNVLFTDISIAIWLLQFYFMLKRAAGEEVHSSVRYMVPATNIIGYLFFATIGRANKLYLGDSELLRTHMHIYECLFSNINTD